MKPPKCKVGDLCIILTGVNSGKFCTIERQDGVVHNDVSWLVTTQSPCSVYRLGQLTKQSASKGVVRDANLMPIRPLDESDVTTTEREKETV